MPRVKACAEQYRTEDFLREVRMKQGYYDLMQAASLAEETGIPKTTLWRRLGNPDDLTVVELRKLIGCLKLDPMAVLTFLGYSGKELKMLKGGESA